MFNWSEVHVYRSTSYKIHTLVTHVRTRDYTVSSTHSTNFYLLKQSLSTMSNMDCQLLRQKVHQKISVIKTNTDVFVVFKTKCELKCQMCLFSLLRFSDELSDVITIDDPYLTL